MFAEKTEPVKSFTISFSIEEFREYIEEMNKVYAKIPPTEIPVLLQLKDLLVAIDNNN